MQILKILALLISILESALAFEALFNKEKLLHFLKIVQNGDLASLASSPLPATQLASPRTWRYLGNETGGDSPLHLAARFNQIVILEQLWPLYNNSPVLYLSNGRNLTPIHEAVLANSSDVVRFLIDKEPTLLELRERQFSRTPFYIACEKGHLAVAKYLRQKGARYDVLSNAEYGLSSPIHEAVYYNHSEIVSFLLSLNPWQVWYTQAKGDTPVHMAAFKGSLKILQQLLAVDYRVAHKVNDLGSSCLHYAVLSNSVETVSFLVDSIGMNVNQTTDRDQLSPLHLAARNGSLAMSQFLVSRGANVYAKATVSGQMPIHFAAAGHSQLVAFYVNRWPNLLTAESTGGDTPAGIAAISGHLDILRILVDLNAEAVLSYRTPNSATLLHFAAWSGSFEMINYLLENGADLYAQTTDACPEMPIHYAFRNSKFDLVNFFVEQHPELFDELNRCTSIVSQV